MSVVMVLFVMGAFGLAVWISGVGVAPFVVADAIIPVVLVPAVLVMISVSPARFFGAFRTAVRPMGVSDDERAAAGVVLRGYSRMIWISLAVFVTIGGIAIVHDLPGGSTSAGVGTGFDAGVGADPMYSVLTGSATLFVDLLYALILQAVLVQPLLIRLDRAAVSDSDVHHRS